MHVIEVVSDRHLRSELGLSEGSPVVIEAPSVLPIPFRRRLAWILLWASRRHLYYKSDRYVWWMARLLMMQKWAGQTIPTTPIGRV